MKFDFQLKLNANAENFNLDQYKQTIQKLLHKTDFLDNIRKYLTIISKLDYKMSENMQKIVENDIVTMRKNNVNEQTKEKMSIDQFHLLLVVAR